LGGLGKIDYRATVELPDGYSADIPNDLKLQTNFADYNASYSVSKGVLSAERIVIRKKSKVAVGEWEEYRKFVKAVTADENQFIQLVRSGGRVVVNRESEEASRLIQEASQAIQDKQIDKARDLLAQAERLNPKESRLWAMYGYFFATQGQTERAIEAMRKEIAYHPGTPGIYEMLAATQRQNGQAEAAVQTLRQWVEDVPDNIDAALALSSAQIVAKQYSQAVAPLQTALKNNPGEVRLEIRLLDALLHSGKNTEGSVLLATLRGQTLDAEAQNEFAYVLADTATELAVALEFAQKSVTAFEEQSKAVTLTTVSKDDLRRVRALGETWDTLGWAYFRTGDLAKAEKFINAAWVLVQESGLADHLGQVYERQGKKAEAIHAYQLALTTYRADRPETRQRLEKLGGTAEPFAAGVLNQRTSLRDELSQMRSIPVPGITEQTGNAEFFLLFSVNGVEEVRFISGSGKLEQASGVLSRLSYKLPFPDEGPERIARRGILSCSQYTTPKCNFVLFLPQDTRK
jgi:tetratricopeptide (TPR) repeat protein